MSEECGVSFDVEFDEENQLYVETWRTARKPHRCGECQQSIAIGDRYLRVVGKTDGRIWTALLHEACNEILHEFNEGGWYFGRLREDFSEVWAAGNPLQPCLNRLTSVAAKAKLRELWLRDKGLADLGGGETR